ncbi:hypothetical protein VE01_08962 [Pseudogymnoascus verrucosus]|uniref:Uncharacterized protein n=1 Tax=Pseudogymnoascus verrucosus TaxID=342668 RepID=A0A1B8GB99_9PEZI|nr:uncharacterized protein VE01_08962 [Pseudogymnoascus verrucosus]OBT93108.1 hypothetical protein VE01_08962 [Pseudogymnoascus verrucosus]
MAISHSSPPNEAQLPPYPSFEALRAKKEPPRITLDTTQRLFWPLDGPLSTSISIMKDASSPDSLEPYFKQTSDGAGIWHPVSQMPLTEPKEDYWLEDHEEHSSPGGSGEPSARYGELPDLGPEDEWEEGSDDHLLICCDEVRPRGKAVKLVVKPAAGENGFITVHDYVSAVHPWLASIQEDILNSMGMFQRPVPLAAEPMVNYNALDRLMMENKPDWIQEKRMRFLIKAFEEKPSDYKLAWEKLQAEVEQNIRLQATKKAATIAPSSLLLLHEAMEIFGFTDGNELILTGEANPVPQYLIDSIARIKHVTGGDSLYNEAYTRTILDEIIIGCVYEENIASQRGRSESPPGEPPAVCHSHPPKPQLIIEEPAQLELSHETPFYSR